MHAKYALGEDNINMVSIGTGMSECSKIDPNTTTDVTWLEETGTLLTTVE